MISYPARHGFTAFARFAKIGSDNLGLCIPSGGCTEPADRFSCHPQTSHNKLVETGYKLQHHLLIAGTGRSGTSFLVRYLTELGLDTHITRHGEQSLWTDEANAGLEDIPLLGVPGEIPYVAKSPWLYQFIDQLLQRDDIRIDGVILPIRDLIESTSSRTILELRRVHQDAPWMSELDETWEQWGYTPGGMLFSLNPLDQARLLATGFHRLVEKLVKADIKISFVHFPRMISDADHLFQALKIFLPESVSLDRAREVHAQLADPGKVRVESEIRREPAAGPVSMVSSGIKHPSKDENDNIALKRELQRVRAETAAVRQELSQAQAGHSHVQKTLDEQMEFTGTLEKLVIQTQNEIQRVYAELDNSRAEVDQCNTALENSNAEAAQYRIELQQRTNAVGTIKKQLEETEQRVSDAEIALRQRETEVAHHQAYATAIENSLSWKFTAPIRSARALMRKSRS